MNGNANAGTAGRSNSVAWILAALVAAGLVVRLLLVPNEGFSTDISTFQYWAISLAEKGFGHFYDSGSFADYPPGYFYILGALGQVWEAFFKRSELAGHYAVLKLLVELPGIVADLCVGLLSYAIVRRFAPSTWALGAAALYLLNPAVIYNSAALGQVDSVAAGFQYAGHLACCFDRTTKRQLASVGTSCALAWVAIAYSLLIKPQAAVVVPIMLAVRHSSTRRDGAPG